MIVSNLYKIYPLINNSFEETLKVLIWYICRNYDIKETIYHTSLSPDKTTIGSRYNLSNLKKPEFISVRVNYCTNHSWSNAGGIEYCTIKTKDDVRISVRWESINNDAYKEFNYTELDNKFYRKVKLIKLNQIT